MLVDTHCHLYFDELLKQTNSKWIMTAHHGNDNVETILMNIARHSGILGMRGIAKERNSLLRPMLEFTKNEITEFSERAGFHFFEDLSNYDNIYLRNFLRNIVIKPWEKEVPHLISGFTKSIDYFKQWQVGLDFLIKNYLMEDIKKFEDKFELPRFPINEKSGDLKRFKFLIDLIPFQYQSLVPEEKFIKSENNPPKMIVDFFEDQKNLNNLSCFSNEGNSWKKTKIQLNEKKLIIKFNEKFFPRRGRINCSLNDNEGWRWFGVQFTVKEN